MVVFMSSFVPGGVAMLILRGSCRPSTHTSKAIFSIPACPKDFCACVLSGRQVHAARLSFA
jgi:hypothetical protein